MERGAFRLVAVVAGIAVIGMTAGVAIYVAAPGGEEEVMPSVQARTPEDCGLNIFGPPAPTPVKGVPFSDPDAGLPDAERLAKYERAEKEGEVRYAPGWSA